MSDYAAGINEGWDKGIDSKARSVTDSPTKYFENVASDAAVTVNPLHVTPKTTNTSAKQPLTFETVAADILRTQGVDMAYKLFGLNLPGGGVDPERMFSGILLGRLSSNSGAGTDHLHAVVHGLFECLYAASVF